MPEMNIPSEFEQRLRQAVDVPEPSSASLNSLRERFITQGVAQLRSPNGAPAIRHRLRGPTGPAPGSYPCRRPGSLPWFSWSCWPCW